jgi:hypothetical protein
VYGGWGEAKKGVTFSDQFSHHYRSNFNFFCKLKHSCKISKPYDNPFWEKNNPWAWAVHALCSDQNKSFLLFHFLLQDQNGI